MGAFFQRETQREREKKFFFNHNNNDQNLNYLTKSIQFKHFVKPKPNKFIINLAMYSRARKSQENSTNGNIDEISSYNQHQSHNSTNSNNNNNHHHHHHHHNHHHSHLYPHTNTIPANKDGKRYTMNEVFQVWYDNKDQILNNSVPVGADEPYKLSKPEPIYHLDLQSNLTKSEDYQLETTKEVTDSLDKLTIGADSEVDTATQPSTATGGPSATTGTATISSIQQAPPGMSQLHKDFPSADSKFRPLVTSDKIEWHYIDPSGNEQGPFNGDMMQDWLAGGYLNLELKIRRKEEGSFRTLRDLCESLQNYVTPFKVPLPDLTAPRGGPGTSSGNVTGNGVRTTNGVGGGGSQFFSDDLLGNSFPNFQSNLLSSFGSTPQNNSSQANLFGNDFMKLDPFANPLPSINPTGATGFTGSNFGIDTFNQHTTASSSMDAFNQSLGFPSMPTLLQQQLHQQQQPSLSRVNSGWGVDTSASSILHSGSNPQTPIGGHSVLNNSISQPAPMSPWLPEAVTQSHSRVGSPFTSSVNLIGGDADPLASIQPETDVARNNTAVSIGGVPQTRSTVNTKSSPQPEDPVLDDIHNSVVTDILNDDEPNAINNQHDQAESVPVVNDQAALVQPTASESRQSISSETAAKVSEPEQQQEQQQEPEPEQVKAVELKPSTPQVLAPWAAAKADSKKPALTLKEIQRLEAEKLNEQKRIEAQIKSEQAAKAWANAAAAEKAVKAEKTPVALPSTWGSASNVPVTKTLAEIQREEAERAKAKQAAAKVNSPSTSFAHAIANSVPRDDGPAWTTVTSKKQASAPVVKKAATTTTIPTSVSKTTPQLLRSVSANKQTVSAVNAQAIREDFLVWARSSMTSLYPTVSKDDLLEIFITLPPNSADSSSLIAETIYSSSATMDGRRFAQEFLKRRQKVDQQIGGGDHVSWSAAIISSADKVQTVDEDGWSTSLKSKKKNGKRN